MKSFKSLSGAMLLLCACFSLASCGEQAELEQPDATNGETVAVTKELRINVLPMQSVGSLATRAASEQPEQGESIGITYDDDAATRGTSDMTAQESDIKNAYILQFDGTSPTSVLKVVKAITAAGLNGVNPITCNFDMTAGQKNRVYVIANCASAPTMGITLAAFEAFVTFAPSAGLPATGLPMSALQDIGVGDMFDVFQLKSALAKLKFTCATAGAVLTLNGVPNGYSFRTQMQPGDDAVRPNGMTYRNIAVTSGTTYYVPANLAGRNNQLVQFPTRCSFFAPANSMLVKIGAYGTTYNLYLGDGSVSDFNVVGGYSYDIKATLYGTDPGDMRVEDVSSITALDGGGTANCYIVPASNRWYTFNGTVMGNGATTPVHDRTNISGDRDFPAIVPSTLNPASATVLWEEGLDGVNLDSKVSVVNKALYVIDGRVYFRTSGYLGNAVVVAKDASGAIVWSWHIWRTGTPPTGITLNPITSGGFTAPALTMMDRNLGALRATLSTNAFTEQDYGLYYQWGRKDPFQTLGSVTSTVGGMAITPAHAVKNPTTFYTGADWTSRNDNLWGCPFTEIILVGINSYFNQNAGSKTIYDPCPVGWKVMPAYAFADAFNTVAPWDPINKGREFGNITSEGISFHLIASGYRSSVNGTLGSVGVGGLYWAASPDAMDTGNGSRLGFDDNNLAPPYSSHRSNGYVVRCVQN